MGYLAGVGECELAAGERKGRCAWCGAELAGRRRRWCSDECAVDGYLGNHSWGSARRLAIARACVTGGRMSGVVCQFCGAHCLDVDVEVDHIEAANGQHGKTSCIHHQDNLRVLCESCHKKRTAEQSRERARARRWAKAPQAALFEVTP